MYMKKKTSLKLYFLTGIHANDGACAEAALARLVDQVHSVSCNFLSRHDHSVQS